MSSCTKVLSHSKWCSAHACLGLQLSDSITRYVCIGAFYGFYVGLGVYIGFDYVPYVRFASTDTGLQLLSQIRAAIRTTPRVGKETRTELLFVGSRLRWESKVDSPCNAIGLICSLSPSSLPSISRSNLTWIYHL